MGLLRRWQERRRERNADRAAIRREQLDELRAGEDPEAEYDRVRNAFESRFPPQS